MDIAYCLTQRALGLEIVVVAHLTEPALRRWEPSSRVQLSEGECGRLERREAPVPSQVCGLEAGGLEAGGLEAGGREVGGWEARSARPPPPTGWYAS